MKHPTREECERLLDQYGTPSMSKVIAVRWPGLH